jgi:hypothetical protein
LWSAFTSTSLDINVAKRFAKSNGTIFEIELDRYVPHPHASISHISYYPGEKEVLILPFFSFYEVSRREE